jgi:hypothetical protein
LDASRSSTSTSNDLNQTIPAVIVTPLDRALPPSAASLADAIKMITAAFRQQES